jgi:hypothetical protein
MRPYRVVGFVQYFTDCATEVSRIQLADSPEDAIKQVTTHWERVNAAGGEIKYSWHLRAICLEA